MRIYKYVFLMLVLFFPRVSIASILDNYLENSKLVPKYAEWIHSRHKGIRYSKALDLSEMIVIEASNTNLKPNILLALIETESSFRPKVVSNKGAIGLTQVIPKYHRDVVKNSKLKVGINSITAGAMVLAQYIEKHKGNIRKALKDYYGSRKEKGDEYASKVLKLAYAVRTGKNYVD